MPDPRLTRRLAFVGLVELFTLIGLLVAADLRTQWWALLPPLLLFVDPVVRIARDRRRAASEPRVLHGK